MTITVTSQVHCHDPGSSLCGASSSELGGGFGMQLVPLLRQSVYSRLAGYKGPDPRVLLDTIGLPQGLDRRRRPRLPKVTATGPVVVEYQPPILCYYMNVIG